MSLLEIRGITKRYGNVTVVRGVDLQLRRGEIHALLGANGAGKSTLCKMVAGLTDVTDGTMRLDDSPHAPADKQAAERQGVQIVQQELNLIPTLNVAENLLLTNLPATAGVLRMRRLHREARRALDQFGLGDVGTHTPVSQLGVGRQQMLEIATALHRSCRVLILDEPTAALSGSETQRLFEHLKTRCGQGVGVLYISHRLDEVKQIADRVTVLRDGEHVGTFDTSQLSTDQMVDLMSGTVAGDSVSGDPPAAAADRDDVPPYQSHVRDEAVLVVDRICSGPVRDVSFDVRAGERFGITGLVGAGRTELLRALFGADVAESGTVSVAGRGGRSFSNPRQAVDGGLAMVTEDRKQNGLLLQQSIRTNTSLSALGQKFARLAVVRGAAEAAAVRQMCRRLDTRCTGIEQTVDTLSGGNQQKVVVAKWLTRGADVYLFDEPTRGIDVAARRRIYQLIDTLAARGKGIVIVSSDLEELFETCDRIAVLSGGRMQQTFERGDWSEERILQACFSRGPHR